MEVSVIVPVYNVEKYVEKCLDSIMRQTFQDFEVLVVNDGSTDESEKIILDFASRHSDKVKVICQENQGLSAARNTGLEKASGKYILFIDSDDTIESRMLEELYQKAEEKKSDLVMCAFRSVDEDGKELKIVRETGLNEMQVYDLTTKKDLLLCQNAAWNKLYKREIIEKYHLKFTVGAWYEDIRFTKKYMLHAKNVTYSDKVLYNYLIRSGSIMNSMGSERNKEILDAFVEIKTYYEEQHVYEKYKQEIEFLAIEHIYIATLVRLIRGKKRSLMYEIRDEFEKMFPNYHLNGYLGFLEKNKKIIFKMLEYKMYTLIELVFKIKGEV